MRKSGEKRGRLEWGGHWGVVVSAGPGSRLSCVERLESLLAAERTNLAKLIMNGQCLNLFAVAPPCPPDIIHVMDNTRPSLFFAALPHPCIIVNSSQGTENE